MRAITPAAKFSVTTSDTATSARSSCLPRSSRRLIVMPSFSTLWLLNPLPNSMPRRSSTNGPAPRHDVPRALLHRVLDPDHLRADGGEVARGARAGELAAQVADADVRERTHSAHPHGHRRVAAHGRRVDALEPALVDLPRGVALQRLVQRDAAFEPRHRGADAEVRAVPERRAGGRSRGGCRSGRGRGSGARRGRRNR